jgi:hypothetical protein
MVGVYEFVVCSAQFVVGVAGRRSSVVGRRSSVVGRIEEQASVQDNDELQTTNCEL